jgi:insulin receptor
MERWSRNSLQIVFVTTLAITWSVGLSFSIDPQPAQLYGNNNNYEGGRICQRTNIWHPEELEELRGCTVIEGSLQINMVFQLRGESVSTNITFPELREITGFLMAFSTTSKLSFKTLFPNLAVIRGQELVENYALVVFKMSGMEEIGLPSLTNILRGAVWIVDNENLCYVDTVDWTKITNESSTDGVLKNKQQCPDTCPQCPRSDVYNDRNLCWSKNHCQIVPTISCGKCGGRPCFGDKTDLQCCHRQCLGGCFGPSNHQCYVCKGVVVNRPGESPVCSDKCPSGFYEVIIIMIYHQSV